MVLFYRCIVFAVASGRCLLLPCISCEHRTHCTQQVLLLTVCEGTFRGHGDTRTPAAAALAAAAANLALDPILMFKYNMVRLCNARSQ
jgi:hypothetical protein